MKIDNSCAKLARSVIGDMKLLADSLEDSAACAPHDNALRRDNAVSILRECEERVLDALGLSHCAICGEISACGPSQCPNTCADCAQLVYWYDARALAQLTGHD